MASARVGRGARLAAEREQRPVTRADAEDGAAGRRPRPALAAAAAVIAGCRVTGFVTAVPSRSRGTADGGQREVGVAVAGVQGRVGQPQVAETQGLDLRHHGGERGRRVHPLQRDAVARPGHVAPPSQPAGRPACGVAGAAPGAAGVMRPPPRPRPPAWRPRPAGSPARRARGGCRGRAPGPGPGRPGPCGPSGTAARRPGRCRRCRPVAAAGCPAQATCGQFSTAASPRTSAAGTPASPRRRSQCSLGCLVSTASSVRSARRGGPPGRHRRRTAGPAPDRPGPGAVISAPPHVTPRAGPAKTQPAVAVRKPAVRREQR